MSKKTVAVIFGGRSSEHEVSLVSAQTVIDHINRDLYDVVLIGITKEGKWILVENEANISNGEWLKGTTTAVLSPDATTHGLILIKGNQFTTQYVDVIFPVLHGLFGEDGTIQGLFEMARIPYVGCGVVASGVGMDKLFTKIIVDTLNVRQAKYVGVLKHELDAMEDVITRVEKTLQYPVFVKPSNAGSSCGVSKAHDAAELKDALLLAAKHDRKILVEETIVGREIECGVLGGALPKASGVGEVVASADFYDYDAKYHSAQSKTIIQPEFPQGVEDKVRDAAVRIFKAIDGYGLARVDFFLEKGTNEVVFNEINTLPGFTSISMYPMLWEAKGISKPALVEKLIQTAFVRYEE